MTRINKSKSSLIYKFAMIASTILVVGVCGYLYNVNIENSIGNVIIAGVLLIAGIFSVSYTEKHNGFLFNNSFIKFFIDYEICLVASAVFAYFPDSEWIFLPVFISLMLFSDEISAVLLGANFVIISIMLSSSADFVSFITYFAPGVVGIILFKTIDEEFKILYPLVVSLGLLFLTLCVKEILILNVEFSFSLFLIPLYNILISIAVIFFILKIFSYSLLYKNDDRCLDIIDPEFELLAALKEKSKEDYDHAIYTAVLCSKMASFIGLDENVSKACGYYHKIGVLAKSQDWKDVEELLHEYEFPENIISLLKEYNMVDGPVKSKETVLVLFADTVISSIRYLFVKDKNAVIDYDKLINAIFEKKINSGAISWSKISYEEISIIKEKLVDEKMFYDFLR
ncbi:MAG: hypothetical protein MJZ11_00235 [Lachnospiraceae bacterium]|nr:hypothetical protein [Lachnospiraceae bacterium]